jgi:DNA-binding MarR family transcriptional regulator
MAKSADLLPSDMLCFAVYSAAHAFGRAYRPLLAPHGLTYPQYLVLTLLWAGDGRSVGEIGEPLHLDSGTLTPLLRRLEKAGLVRRARDPADERQVRIWLTETGRALRATLAHVPAAIGCATGLEAGDVPALMRSITAFSRALRGAGDPDQETSTDPTA